MPDETPLCDILARTTAAWTVDFVLESADSSRLPIQLVAPRLDAQAGDQDESKQDTSAGDSKTKDQHELPPGTISVSVTDGMVD